MSSDSKISGFTRPHVLRFVADLFFSALEVGLKNIRIRCRIRQMRMDRSRTRKEKLRIKKYPDTCGRGLDVELVFGLLEDRKRSPTLARK